MANTASTSPAIQTSSATTAFSDRRAVFFIFITLLIDSIGFGIIIPVTPPLIMQLTGEGLSAAAKYGGWLAVAYASMQFVFSPVFGSLSDRFGRRPILLFCLLALGLDYFVMGFAPRLEWLFVGRFIAGIAGATWGPAYAYLADVSPPEKRAANFGVAGIAFGMGFIAGPALGGLLGELGVRLPFFAAGALALANATLGFFALPESLKVESRRKFEWARANPVGTLLQMGKFPSVLGIAAAAFIWQLGHQVLPSMWSYYTMYKFKWSSAEVGWSLAATGVVMAIGQGFLIGKLIPRLGERRAALFAMALGTAIFALYAFANASWMMYAGTAGWLFVSLTWPSINALMSKQIPPNAQGELQGGMASLSSINSILGPYCFTQLFAYFTSSTAPIQFPGAPFLATALLALTSVVLLWIATRKRTLPIHS
jgi:DHA1 family tetracycline resistance protein-like MFS transporter